MGKVGMVGRDRIPSMMSPNGVVGETGGRNYCLGTVNRPES